MAINYFKEAFKGPFSMEQTAIEGQIHDPYHLRQDYFGKVSQFFQSFPNASEIECLRRN